MQTAPYTTKEISYPHYGMVSYRIEHKQEGNRWFFRHIWTDIDGEIGTDEWTQINLCAKEIAALTGAA